MAYQCDFCYKAYKDKARLDYHVSIMNTAKGCKAKQTLTAITLENSPGIVLLQPTQLFQIQLLIIQLARKLELIASLHIKKSRKCKHKPSATNIKPTR